MTPWARIELVPSKDSRHRPLLWAVVLNSAILSTHLLRALFGGNPFAFLMILTVLPVLWIFVNCLTALFHAALARREIGFLVRLAVDMIPLTLLYTFLALLPSVPTPHNQRGGMESPDGAYRLGVPIVQGMHRLTIHDADGQMVYQDAQSGMVAHLSVYFAWDREGRAWLYESDTGRLYYWERIDGAWEKRLWAGEPGSPEEGAPYPPFAVLPDYAIDRYRVR